MRRHFGQPGRIDLTALDPPVPVYRPKLEALVFCGLFLVFILGAVLLGVAVYQLAAHQALAYLARGA